jgi:hypothetical protein
MSNKMESMNQTTAVNDIKLNKHIFALTLEGHVTGVWKNDGNYCRGRKTDFPLACLLIAVNTNVYGNIFQKELS